MLEVSVVRTLRQAADGLGRWWAVPPADPFDTDLLVTPGAGHHRWFSQQLALGLGVTAGVRAITMAQLRRDLTVRHADLDPSSDPWSSTAVTATLVRVFEDHWQSAWMTPVRNHLAPVLDDVTEYERPGRRLATATRLARLLLGYCRRVPSMVTAWEQGTAVGPDGQPLVHDRWQYELWRQLTHRIGAPGPLQRHRRVVEALRDDSDRQRVAVISLEPLAPLDLELLTALGSGRATRLWQLVSADPDRVGPMAPMGRQGAAALAQWRAVEGIELDESGTVLPDQPGTTALGRLQQVLRGADPVRGGVDHSVQVHASHGADRQVEVLREVLCGLFDEHPDLEPRDVVMVCPDLDRFAPLLDAAFGLGDDGHHPGHRLRVQTPGMRVVDNQALALLERILALPAERTTSADLVDLCANPCVRHHFGFGGDNLELVRSLLSRAQVRWGLDLSHRQQAFDLQVPQSTWFAGVERMMLGATMADTPPAWVGLTAAAPMTDAQDLAVAGSLAELVSRLRKVRADTATPATPDQWVTRLDDALGMLASLPRDEQWQLTAARAAVRSWASRAGAAGGRMSRADVHTMVSGLAGRSHRRPAFGNGNLQVVGLDELRGVPHRVVAVLGLDDQCFPARPGRVGDDLVPVADRLAWQDRRLRSQGALLDAILAASDHVVITHAHRDSRTNDPIDEPVAVTELRAAMALVTQPPGRTAPLTWRWPVMTHPLQPHGVDNFAARTGDRPFSFDAHSHAAAGALRLRLEARPEPPVDATTWRFDALDPEEPVALADLLAFWRHPARALLQHTIGASMQRHSEHLETHLPLELFAMSEYTVGEGLLASHASGLTRDEALSLEWLRGNVPPGLMGRKQLERVATKVDRLLDHSLPRDATVTDHPISLTLGTTPLTGMVRLRDGHLVSQSFARLKGSSLLATWLELLAVVAQTGQSVESHVVRKDSRTVLLGPSRAEALAQLGWYLTWYRRGLSRVLLAPMDQLLREASVDGPWERGDDDRARVARAWEWKSERDADWAMFTTEPWEALRVRDSGVDGMTLVQLADHVFGQISQARR
ncbi:exodeoxyribonuclease V subunit gamma [Aestuariimicrobium ganziense]|uniref:exodeoxyribonuclease V subunit gamma n=1 Tax=Aestuariimicrobium ganziense TaxID=2773677 RepID=UPI001940C529|nr:exodeoxyribonuclease V subunit gamma [Aestuariimicrobium ganziense]